jgi:FAD/FMN-containing dehydrogenase
MRKFGLACDNLAAADVVTADGRLVHACETGNAELLWGLRGGRGNFGIVTQFEFDLHPLGPVIYAGPIFYPAEVAPELLRTFRDWSGDAPDEITGRPTHVVGAGGGGEAAFWGGSERFAELWSPRPTFCLLGRY